MTVCVAGLCDDGKAIVLVADKMVGIGIIQAEPQIKKIQKIHRDWWLLMAGNDITPIFDIADAARARLQRGSTDVQAVMKVIEECHEDKRSHDAEALHLKPIGWTLERFNREGHSILPRADEIQTKISDFCLDIELLVAGFGPDGQGRIFTLYGIGEARGVAKRADIPGFGTIGSGGIGGVYMLYYRSYSPALSAREALYYCIEAKFFGEFAGGLD